MGGGEKKNKIKKKASAERIKRKTHNKLHYLAVIEKRVDCHRLILRNTSHSCMCVYNKIEILIQEPV